MARVAVHMDRYAVLADRLNAGTLANTPGNLTAWIADPQGIKPGSQMPNLYLSGAQLNDTRAYLETLR